MIPPALYQGTSYRQLRVLSYPQKPSPERLYPQIRFDFPFVDDPFSALHMAAEAAVKDKSEAAVVVVRGCTAFFEDTPPRNGTYKNCIYVDFEEITPSHLEILLEGRDLHKLGEYELCLGGKRRLASILRAARRFSREMYLMAPREKVPELAGSSGNPLDLIVIKFP